MSKLTVQGVEMWKEMAALLRNMFTGGVVFIVTDREKVIWKSSSDVWDIPALTAGLQLRQGGAPHQCIQTMSPVQEKLPREIYGLRTIMHAFPVFDEDTCVGSFTVALPRIHPISAGFNDIAAVVTNLFPEGASMFMTDMVKYTRRVDSNKFLYTGINVGSPMLPGEPAYTALRSKELSVIELPGNGQNGPVMVMSSPFFDEDNPNLAIGNLGMCLPRNTADELRTMSSHLKQALEEIASAMQELAASACQINENEKNLNTGIDNIYGVSEEIIEITGFIKLIADETKMLGLNAAIEAARAGDAGRGFGVVAHEIRKLSDESKKTVLSISQLIERIKKTISETRDSSHRSIRASEEQAAAAQEVTATIEEISSAVHQLDTIAGRI